MLSVSISATMITPSSRVDVSYKSFQCESQLYRSICYPENNGFMCCSLQSLDSPDLFDCIIKEKGVTIQGQILRIYYIF